MKSGSRAAALAFFGAICASIANAARPSPLPWVLDFKSSVVDNAALAATFEVSYDELAGHLKQFSAAFIDARSAELFAAGHLEGAYNVPSDQMESFAGVIFQNVSPAQLIIVYCDGGNCEASHKVVEFLNASGFRNTRIFKQGWEMLGPSDLPKATGSEPMGSTGQSQGAP